MRQIVLLSLVLAGCPPDYQFPVPDEPVWGEPNPAIPENTVRTDRVLQVVDPVVDTLWVVDNSASMVDDHEALAENFPLFLQPFEDAATDWHVGVVTTDMSDSGHQGRLVQRQGFRWVDADTPDAVSVFTEMTTTLGEAETFLEKGREGAWRALDEHRQDYNFGFRRHGAYLHINVISDEDDATDKDVIGKAEFVDFVNSEAAAHRTTFNSIVALTNRFLERRGDKYISLTEQLGGVVRDVNGGDWTELAAELGGLQAPEPVDEFFLSALPVPDTLEVSVVWAGITFNDYALDTDFSWDPIRNSIRFETMPPMGSAVHITYTVAASQVD